MLKLTLRRILCSQPCSSLWQRVHGESLTVFTLHRFAVPDLGLPGHDPRELGRALEQLRRRKVPILGVPELLSIFESRGKLPRRAAVFTVDDGYFDFAQVGASVFAAYDCPVTVFLVTGFLDGACWLWWDKLRYLLTHPAADRVRAGLWREAAHGQASSERDMIVRTVAGAATRIPHAELMTLLGWMEREVGDPLPSVPPLAFRAMSWPEVASLESRGVSFGPHTVTHPVLSNASPEVARDEIAGSWARIRAMVRRPVPAFCYPNGDFTSREVGLVRACGLRWAFSTLPRYVTPERLRSDPDAAFALPRFPYPDDRESLVLTATGFRLIQERLRVAGRGRPR